MSSIVMTIHTFDHLYAGFSASEIQSSSCHHRFLPVRGAGMFLISEAGNRHHQVSNGKRYREMWQRAAEICGGEAQIVVGLHDHSSTRTTVHKGSNTNPTSTR
jgi:hypothetical protein